MGVLELVLLIISTVIVLLLVAIIGVSVIASNKMASPPRKIGSWTPGDLGLEFDKIEYEAEGGIKLRGWKIKGDPRRAVILIHGYTSSKWDEGCMKPALEMLAKNGYTVVAVDMRAHGESDGKVTTLGYLEARDVAKIAEDLRKSGVEKVALYGFSMGGAISLMAAGIARPDAIVLDSPYVDIRSSGRRWVRRVKGPLGALLRMSYPLITRMVASKIGVKPEELVMFKYVKDVKAPVLIIAGKRDDLVAVEELRKLYEELGKAGIEAELWEVDTAHVNAINDYREEYEKRVISFLKKHVG